MFHLCKLNVYGIIQLWMWHTYILYEYKFCLLYTYIQNISIINMLNTFFFYQHFSASSIKILASKMCIFSSIFYDYYYFCIYNYTHKLQNILYNTHDNCVHTPIDIIIIIISYSLNGIMFFFPIFVSLIRH